MDTNIARCRDAYKPVLLRASLPKKVSYSRRYLAHLRAATLTKIPPLTLS